MARSKQGVVLSQRKYIRDLLTTTGMLGAKPVGSPMDQNVVLDDTQSPRLKTLRGTRV